MKAKFIPFSAQSRMSGVEMGSSWIRKGAIDAILNYLDALATATDDSGSRAIVAAGGQC